MFRRLAIPYTTRSPISISTNLHRNFVTSCISLQKRAESKYKTVIPITGFDQNLYYFARRFRLTVFSERPLSKKIIDLRLPLFTPSEPNMPKAAYYAVKEGVKPGIYGTWAECEAQVKGFKGAAYKKFVTQQEALAFIGNGSPSTSKPYSSPITSASSSETGKVSKPKTTTLFAAHETNHPARPRELQLAEAMAINEGFNVTPSGMLVAYCDGSARGNGQKGSKAGLGVYWGSDGEAEKRNLAEPVPGIMQTNNRGELLAIVRAIEDHPHPSLPLEIRTDSQYSISCLTQYLPKWLRNGFKTATGTPVKNCDLLVHLMALMNRMGPQRIRFVHVKGHSGHWGNEEADRLANLGATIPTPPDRTNWFNIQDANEFARVVIEEKKQENKNATPDLAEVSIEVDIDPDWMLSVEELKELGKTQQFDLA